MLYIAICMLHYVMINNETYELENNLRVKSEYIKTLEKTIDEKNKQIANNHIIIHYQKDIELTDNNINDIEESCLDFYYPESNIDENIVYEEDNTKCDEEFSNNSVLTASSGVNYFGNQRETYYNLDMSGCIQIMRDMGNTDEYWVREDGCKMLGDYIMIAANLNVYPRGSLVETSLGTGIVVDTGEFAESDPYQVDIAVTW